eukprot:gene2509-3107_t
MVTKTILGEEFHDNLNDCIPFFLGFIILEIVVGVFIQRRKNLYSLSDSLTSMGTGISTMVLEKLMPSGIVASIEFIAVIYIYRNYRLFEFNPDSWILWLATFIIVDFIYYWFHRLAHEINVMWNTHVTHHSSEKYNLTTALRQGVFQIWASWVFYLPLGFFIPPQVYFFHKQFNTLYQFWIHTQLIGKLGPIEWIFNTPSHHRVHHARNPKYLDKNYAGTLIIWDRLFGTFEPEDEKVYYGLVHALNSHDPSWCQVHHWHEIYEKLKLYPSWADKLKVLVYGPGWSPGTPRLGDNNTLPIPSDKDEKERLYISLPFVLNLYLFSHYMAVSLASLIIQAMYETEIGKTNVTLTFAFLFLSLTSFGAIFDRKRYAIILELTRLSLFIVYTWGVTIAAIEYFRMFYFFSALWLIGRYFTFPFYGTSQKVFTKLKNF